VWRRAGAALVLLACASPAAGQAGAAPADDAAAVQYLPRSAFHLTAERLAEGDPRFLWDAHFGGELDFIDYGAGRFTFLADYQVLLGDEIRAFDPNQGNYVLGARSSLRLGATEVAAVFHHQSRHLSDRDKQEPVDWNSVGAQVRHGVGGARARLEGRLDVRRVIQKSFVDYAWELDAAVRGDRRLRPGLGVLGAAGVVVRGVDGSRDRAGQAGYRVEGGVRVEGHGAAVELFVAGERRIDPWPLERGTASWVAAGFRLLSAP
jgi:hypothetical protein